MGSMNILIIVQTIIKYYFINMLFMTGNNLRIDSLWKLLKVMILINSFFHYF